MKKFVAALLVLTMVLALCSTAFAYKAVATSKYVQFTGSAWGYNKVTNNYGKSKSSVALRKGSIAHVVAVKGDWYQIEIPKRDQVNKYDLLWFNSKYTGKTTLTTPVLLYSSGGSGRSTATWNDLKKIPSVWKKVTVLKGRRTNVRSTPSLAGKSLGVIGKGHAYTVKLAADHRVVADSRGVPFFHIIYKGKPAWVSMVYLDKLKK